MQEIETKILDVNAEEIKKKLNSLGAQEILNTRLTVDWYGPQGLTHDGDDPWFLRIRTDGEGNSEATWKGNRNFKGASSSHKEINLKIIQVKIGKIAINIENKIFVHFLDKTAFKIITKKAGAIKRIAVSLIQKDKPKNMAEITKLFFSLFSNQAYKNPKAINK